MSKPTPLPPPTFGPEHMNSAFAAALKESGVSLKDAAYYLKQAGLFGQVGFATGKKNNERLTMMKAARGSMLDSLASGAGGSAMNSAMLLALIPHTDKDLHKVDKAVALITEAKKKALKLWSDDDFMLPHVAKLSDPGRDEMIGMLCGSDVFECAPMDSWERVDYKARFLAGDPPAITDGTHGPDQGSLCLEPAKIEAALVQKASLLMERFGLGNIRISGFPSLERADATLDSLALGLKQTAKAAGIPEKAMGLGGEFCIHVNADVGKASGYACSWTNTVCLSPDNGWKTLAHEWFHAFDASVGPLLTKSHGTHGTHATEAIEKLRNLSKLPKEAKDHEGQTPEFWRRERDHAFSSSAPFAAQADRLALAGAGMMHAIRHASESNPICAISQEENEHSTQRVIDGLYDRFYKNRVEPGLEAQALDRFKTVFASVLDGKAGIPEIAQWREEHLKDRAGLSKHYDGFVMAEKTARDSRIEARTFENESTMERFAKIADKHLAQATGGNSDWTGYSNSSVEMSARAFEGNCFLDTPDVLRHYMVDGRDNSMYWPVGAERGAHKDAFRAYLARGTMAMVESGLLERSILNGFEHNPEPKTLGPLALDTSLAQLSEKLAAKRREPESCTASIMPLKSKGSVPER